MINAYSLAAEVLYGDMDKTYPIITESEMKLREKTMKLSLKTITLLKNFSDINQSILFKKGNSLRTISVMKNVLAEATIDEDLPTDFGIYDLSQFLNGLSLHTRPELDFQNEVKDWIKENYPEDMKLRYMNSPNGHITRQEHMKWQQALHEKGWSGINWPKEFGGAEFSAAQKYLFNKEMSAAHAPSVVAFGEKMVAPVIMAFGNEDQKNKLNISRRYFKEERIWLLFF